MRASDAGKRSQRRIVLVRADRSVLDPLDHLINDVSGTRNHSRGTMGLPKRALTSMSRRARPNTRWMMCSSLERLMLNGR